MNNRPGMDSETSDLEMFGRKRSPDHKRQGSNSKPPLSSQKKNKKKRTGGLGDEMNDDELHRLKDIYGDPYNIGGKVHPGVRPDLRSDAYA